MGGMGQAADFLWPRMHGISREEQDELAALSHQRASTAAAEGRFDTQLVPVEVQQRSGSTVVLKDESPRPDATIEKLARLAPAFSGDGTVTGGQRQVASTMGPRPWLLRRAKPAPNLDSRLWQCLAHGP